MKGMGIPATVSVANIFLDISFRLTLLALIKWHDYSVFKIISTLCYACQLIICFTLFSSIFQLIDGFLYAWKLFKMWDILYEYLKDLFKQSSHKTGLKNSEKQ